MQPKRRNDMFEDEDEGRWRFESDHFYSYSSMNCTPSRRPLGGVGKKIVPLHQLPWWRKDRHGWPVESIKGRPIRSFIRIVVQNIRKIRL